MMTEGLDATIIDVKTAFLYGRLDEEIYMTVPEGYREEHDIGEDECLLLQQALYGLVQAAHQWWKRLVAELCRLGFKLTADPCLLV